MCIRAFLERYFAHPSMLYIVLGVSYIIRLYRISQCSVYIGFPYARETLNIRVFLLFGLCRVCVVCARVCNGKPCIILSVSRVYGTQTYGTQTLGNPIKNYYIGKLILGPARLCKGTLEERLYSRMHVCIPIPPTE